MPTDKDSTNVLNTLYFSINPVLKISILIIFVLSMSYYYWILSRYPAAIAIAERTAEVEVEAYTIRKNDRNAKSVEQAYKRVQKTKEEYSSQTGIFNLFALLLLATIGTSIYLEISSRSTAKNS
jgi:hypothetical protein